MVSMKDIAQRCGVSMDRATSVRKPAFALKMRQEKWVIWRMLQPVP